MAPKRPRTHLTAERIQAFLDDALARDDRAEVQEHATFCGRCHAELEAWQFLYSELRGLPELSPAPNFRDRVPQPASTRPFRPRKPNRDGSGGYDAGRCGQRSTSTRSASRTT